VMTRPMVATRPRKMSQDLTTAGALAVATFVALYFPNRDDTASAIFGAVFAFCASVIGLAAAGRVRPLPRRRLKEQGRLMALSLIIGSALGVANLIANYTVASLDALSYVRMTGMYARASAWSGVFATPILEEIGFRLFLMGGIAWLLSRSTDDRRTVFLVALGVSALVFALLHLLRPPAGFLDATVVVLKAGAAGLLLGSVFWRWGLPYSIVCHGATNGMHLLVMPAFF
jgi:membrane protease YdiL (CAAX protease family)